MQIRLYYAASLDGFIADESGITNCEYGLRAALVATMTIMVVQLGMSELSGGIKLAAARLSDMSHSLAGH